MKMKSYSRIANIDELLGMFRSRANADSVTYTYTGNTSTTFACTSPSALERSTWQTTELHRAL